MGFSGNTRNKTGFGKRLQIEPSVMKKLYDYFFSNNLSKGYKRLIIVGSFVLPLILGTISYYSSGEERTHYYDGNTYTYYDDGAIIAGFIIGYIVYWMLYFVIVWVLKGFKEDKTLP